MLLAKRLTCSLAAREKRLAASRKWRESSPMVKEGEGGENNCCVSPGSPDGLYICDMLADAQTGQFLRLECWRYFLNTSGPPGCILGVSLMHLPRRYYDPFFSANKQIHLYRAASYTDPWSACGISIQKVMCQSRYM
jgi:hypothetical protein